MPIIKRNNKIPAVAQASTDSCSVIQARSDTIITRFVIPNAANVSETTQNQRGWTCTQRKLRCGPSQLLICKSNTATSVTILRQAANGACTTNTFIILVRALVYSSQNGALPARCCSVTRGAQTSRACSGTYTRAVVVSRVNEYALSANFPAPVCTSRSIHWPRVAPVSRSRES